MQQPVYTIILGLVLVTADRFEEELLVKDLGNGFSGLHLNFITVRPLGDDHNFHIFPKSLNDIVTRYNINEFHLSMVRGFWDRLKWGPPFTSVAPGGAEIWAWFSPATSNVDESWTYFLEALSGQFCASLSQLGLPYNYASPSLSYRPMGLAPNLSFKNASKMFRYAQLPHEVVCTENLTPWSKLLPCKKLDGLASMLKPKSIFRAAYNALSVGARRICSDSECKRLSLELKQSLTFVFDRRHLYSSTHDSWSLTGLLGDKINRACQVAHRSEIIVLHSQTPLDLKPAPDLSLSLGWDSRRVFAVYTPSNKFANDLIITSLNPVNKKRFPAAIENGVSIMKYATGRGDFDGGVMISLCNRLDFPIRTVLLDSSPWYAEMYFSSLSISYQSEDNSLPKELVPDKVIFQPSVQRQQMAFLELVLQLPSRTCTTVSYAFRKILMHWNEYLPDANHGIYLPAATLIYQLAPGQLENQRAASNPNSYELALPLWASTYAEYLSVTNRTKRSGMGEGFVRLYSETTLIRLPVPDFSMPFNALCLVCSVVALLFGGVHKLTTSTMVPVIAEGDEELIDKPPIVRLCQKFKALFRFLREQRHPKSD